MTEHARPIIRSIVRSKLTGGRHRGQEVEDLEQEVLVRVVDRLQRMSECPGESAISDFRGYVAVSAYHACAERFRSPQARLHAEEADVLLAQEAEPRGSILAELRQRDQLQALWTEIRRLPPRQCTALMLNLRDEDGCGAVALFPLTGTATMREIAEVLGMPAEQFAELWNHLPMDDASIAELLGVTRQQVINLRKSARARLARRLKGLL
ncbi:MAG TPA: sigma-70 family RNA polymerase sigma factor [Thermoanaerobaculia bacterium]|nr:sigma-70 family RNA polymerase sigma factor [Thermoanaerobaculia bacterium]